MEQLSAVTLAQAPCTVGVPGYDRATVGAGIVHLGAGNFHRAHLRSVTRCNTTISPNSCLRPSPVTRWQKRHPTCIIFWRLAGAEQFSFLADAMLMASVNPFHRAIDELGVEQALGTVVTT